MPVEDTLAGQALDTEWAKHYRLPPPGNMMGKDASAEGVFIRQGTRMLSVIEQHINRNFPSRRIGDLDILDFGCGVGRVALPFFYKHQRPNFCADVDPNAIKYLKEVIPDADSTAISYKPPTPFDDNQFDVIYSVSVWTHLPIDLQDIWLLEIARLLKPRGVALITTSSYKALASRREKLPGWSSVRDEDLAEQGIIFQKSGSTPGVTGTYGYTLHTPEYIKDHWGKYFSTITSYREAIEGVQDLNVLKN